MIRGFFLGSIDIHVLHHAADELAYGTGVFVSIGVAAGITGPSVVLAVAIGAMVATFNGLSSAQLAANHPVSGGTYEYGYRYLSPWLGFTAGWMFLLAKSASAATAALGFAGYALNAFGLEGRTGLVPLPVRTQPRPLPRGDRPPDDV